MIFARAVPEKVKITETYEVSQVISKNPSAHAVGTQTGTIEATVPYDGVSYFRQEGVQDVERARGGTRPATDAEAVIGHLVLAESDHLEMGPVAAQMRGEFGVIPLTVPLLAAEEMTAGRQACVITHDYRPKYPEIAPARLSIDITDPDSADYMSLAEELSRRGNDEDEAFIARFVGEIRQRVMFQNMLTIRLSLQLMLPLDPEGHHPAPAVKPMLRRFSIDWPTITSLRTTELKVLAVVVDKAGQRISEPGWHKFPLRYNPVDRRLEWEVLKMSQVAERLDGGHAWTVDYESLPMRLEVGHPGELFLAEDLKVRAEIEIPGYLMSRLDPYLFDATGRNIGIPFTADDESPSALTTRVIINGKLAIDDAFRRRSFSPHHSIVFDDVVPDQLRITDIRNSLKGLGFTNIKEPWSDFRDLNHPKWFLKAAREHGPDAMNLWIYVEGTRETLERKQIRGNERVQTTGNRATGQLKIYLLGKLPGGHQEMTREMNALHTALRGSYQYHTASRR